jgi:hypothetical protein
MIDEELTPEFIADVLTALRQLGEDLNQRGSQIAQIGQQLDQTRVQLESNGARLRGILNTTRSVHGAVSAIRTTLVRGNGEIVRFRQFDSRQDMSSRFHSGTGGRRTPW